MKKIVDCPLCHYPITLYVSEIIKGVAYIEYGHPKSCPVTLRDLGYQSIIIQPDVAPERKEEEG